MEEYGVQIKDVYNYDETPVRLRQGRTMKKITSAKNKTIQAGRNASRESCTIAECIGAKGSWL